MPNVEEWRFEDCEEEVTVYFNKKTNENVSKDSQFPAGILSSFLIHFPAVLQYAITLSENLKMDKSPIK